MELLVNPASYSNAVDLVKLNVHQISIGVKQFAQRNNCELNIEQIKSLTTIKNKTKILILVNKFFFESEINDLQQFLIQIAKLNIDGIIFNDMAIPQICFEKNIKINLIYDPDTLVCNWGQFSFYLQNNISEVSLSRELNAKEIKEIIANKTNMKIQLQVAGYAFVMHSRWKLINNFKNTQNNMQTKLTNKKLLIQEELRDKPLIIYEDENGTHVFTFYNLSLIDKLEELNGVDTIRIDSFLHDETWVLATTKAYLNALNNKPYQLPDSEINSHGFYLMNRKDLIYLLKDEKYE